MNATLYLYLKTPNPLLSSFLEGLYGPLSKHEGLISLPHLEEEGFTGEALLELIISDFDVTLSLLETVPDHPYDEALLEDMMAHVPKGYYDLETLFLTITKRSNTLEARLKQTLAHLLTHELIQTLLAFAAHQMNVSVTAKALYMHRNTMHYRLSSVHKKTALSPYRFETLALFYRFFHA